MDDVHDKNDDDGNIASSRCYYYLSEGRNMIVEISVWGTTVEK